MRTYYIRHADKLDIDDVTRKKIWDARQIALHYPHDKTDALLETDLASVSPDDYSKRGRRAMRILTELAHNGGYVCAEYATFPNSLIGVVRPGSSIEFVIGKWGKRNN